MAGIDKNRAKILGNLIREARQYAGRSATDCANVLNVSAETYEQLEQGEYAVSLPELETLAIYLKVPMGYFWGSESLNQMSAMDYQSFRTLRQRVIGILLRQFRLKARRSTQDLASLLNIPVSQIDAYELGATPIPYLHLEQLSRYLETTVVQFVDEEKGPLARHEAEQRQQKQLRQLAPDMQAFVLNPTNSSYLQTAKLLSEMDVKKLREVAVSLLDITF